MVRGGVEYVPVPVSKRTRIIYIYIYACANKIIKKGLRWTKSSGTFNDVFLGGGSASQYVCIVPKSKPMDSLV